MEAVDDTDTFNTVAPDTLATHGVVPAARNSGPTVAPATYELVGPHPYRFRSSEVIFTVWADHQASPEAERGDVWVACFAKPRACLRSSDLGKPFGWGIHADEHGRIALHGLGVPRYEVLASGQAPDGRSVKVTAAMRSRR
jgi:hypothetical protein